MKFLVFSDLHLHNFREFGTPLPGGLNTRSAQILLRLSKVFKLAVEHQCRVVLFCGDFWETRSYLYVPLLLSVRGVLRKRQREWEEAVGSTRVFAVSGQHDLPGDDSGTALKLLPGWELLSGSALKRVDDVTFAGFDYGGFEEFAAGDPVVADVIIGHGLVGGAYLNDQYQVPADEGQISLKALRKMRREKAAKLVFLGDVHRRQTLAPEIRYVGSLLPKQFGDDDNKGVFVVDTERSWDVEYISIESPQFLDADYVPWCGDPEKKHYYRVFTSTRAEYGEALERFAENSNVRVMPPPPKVRSKTRSELSLRLGNEELVKRYVDFALPKASQKGKKQLVEVGKELLER